MSKVKLIGISLIIVGMFIPLALYPFTTLIHKPMIRYSPTHPRYLEIVIVGGEWKEYSEVSGEWVQKDELTQVWKENKNYDKYGIGHYENRLAIPYSYIMAFGITLAFIGIGIVALYQKKKH